MTVGLRQVRQQFVIGAGGFQANAAACRERCQPSLATSTPTFRTGCIIVAS
jgi:hypothetical protein